MKIVFKVLLWHCSISLSSPFLSDTLMFPPPALVHTAASQQLQYLILLSKKFEESVITVIASCFETGVLICNLRMKGVIEQAFQHLQPRQVREIDGLYTWTVVLAVLDRLL